MKKLNVFELKQVSGGASIAPIPNPNLPKDPKDFFILGDRVPEHPITYEDLKNGFQILFYR